MKTKVIILSVVSFLFTLSAFSQALENDDMYFTSKDRAKLNAQKQAENPSYSANLSKQTKSYASIQQDENINPTDSYSARNINPEYISRVNSQTAQADNQDYFVNNYQYSNSSLNTANKYNQWNNNYTSWYNNPCYTSNYYGSSMNSWNNPYYNNYSNYYNPWSNPYSYNNGWSSSFGYYSGNSWGYGYGMSYGFGSYSNYGYGNSYYNPYYGGGYYHPGNTVVVIENGNHPNYSKRGSRSSYVATTNADNAAYGNVPRRGVTNAGGRSSDNGGRVATQSSHQAEYYNRSWRNGSSSYNNSNSSNSAAHGRSSNWGSSNSSNNSGSFSTPSRSSSFDSGGTRSGGSGGGSSSSSSGGSSGGSRRGH